MIIMQGDDICCIKVFLFLSDELYQNYFKQVKWINNTLIYWSSEMFLCKCCLRKFQYIGSKIVYWSKVFLSKGMVLYFFQKGCYIRTGILVILRCNVISIVIVLTKNRAQEIWTNEKNWIQNNNFMM